MLNINSITNVETVPLASEGDGVTVKWPQLPQRTIWLKEASISGQKTVEQIPPSREKDETSRSYTLVSDIEAPSELPGDWEYLDHTADVQLHAWGKDIARAHAACVLALHAYMVEDASNTVGDSLRVDIRASAHDAHSLLFALLDEFLYIFHTEGFVATRAAALQLSHEGDNCVAVIRAWGGIFKQGLHKQGTEVKAITYSNMQIGRQDSDGNVHIYVIVDI